MTDNKMKAFTILEMVVSMFIAAIVVAFAYTAYHIIHQSYDSFIDKNEKLLTLAQLEKAMENDLWSCKTLKLTDQRLTFTNQHNSTYYEFTSDKIIRCSQGCDTFDVVYKNLSGTRQNKTIAWETSEGKDDTLYIDAFSFQIMLNKDTLPYQFKKKYSSEELSK